MHSRRCEGGRNLKLRVATVVVSVLIVLVSFSAAGSRLAAASQPAPVSGTPGTVYGPGIAITLLQDGQSRIQYLPTFQRWDGVWRPMDALDRLSGEWPYLLEETATEIRATRLGETFNQAKVPGAVYEFLPDRIKETLVISSAPPAGLVRIPFTSAYGVEVAGDSFVLRDVEGAEAWRSAGFHAWDSAEPPRIWSRAISSIAYSAGNLTLALDGSMLAAATYPLYVDPTWELGSPMGWGTSTFQDAVEDKGDRRVKIGWLADNFDDGTNELWTIISGSLILTDGRAELDGTTEIRAGGPWSDQKFESTVNFASSCGLLSMVFRHQDASNEYSLEIAFGSQTLALKKEVAGTVSTISSVSATITGNTNYSAKVVALGNSFEIWWNGAKVWAGTDGSPPGSPLSGKVGFRGAGRCGFNVDNVRVWNTAKGTMTTPIRHAGTTNRPLWTKIEGQVDAYNQVHVQIRSSANNATWGPWTNVKSDLSTGVSRNVPDQDRQRYYQLRVGLTSGVESTPSLSELDTNEVAPPAVTPTSNTGFDPGHPYVGGRVNSVNGNLWYSSGDISVQGRGFNLVFARSYNSLRGSENGPLGNGWTHVYAQKLVVNGDTTVTWNDGDGSQHTFIPKGTTGGYEPPRGITSRLVKNGDGTYTLWHVDGTRHAFTSTGRLSTLTDRNGNKLTFTYDGSGRLTTVADDSGKSLTLGYDASNRITTATDPLNRQITYGYSGSELTSARDALGYYENYTYVSGRMSAIIDPVGKRTAFTYDASSRVTEIWLGLYQGGGVVWQFRDYAIAYSTTTRTITNARGHTTSVTLNSLGLATQVTGPSFGSVCCDQGGNSSSYVWDGEMNRIKTTDGRGNAWSTEFDHRARVVSQTDPGGNVSSSTHAETNPATKYFAVVASQTNFRGYTTTYAYDGNGNVVKVTNARGDFSENGYDSLGFLNWSKDFRGSKTWYEYNANGNLIKVTNPVNAQTRFGYDAVGRRTTATSPGGHVTTTVYDADDRIVNVTDPLGNFTRSEYNGRGDRTKAIDPNGFATTYAYNVTNRAVQFTTDALGNQTTYAYDLRGKVVSVTNARNFTTTYEYDAYDRQMKVTSPLGFATTLRYEAAGNQIGRTDAKGQATTYSYDKSNRLTTTKYPGGTTVTFAYDKNSNPTSETGFGYTKTTAYDTLDRVTSITTNYGSFSKTITHTYDANGNRLSVRQNEDPYPSAILRPTANGGTVQWSPLGCTQNWDCVNDVTSDGDSTVVAESAPGEVDLYQVQDLPAGATTVRSVKVSAVARVPTPCEDVQCYGYMRLRLNGYEGSNFTVWNSYVTLTSTWTTNPATGMPWTVAEVSGIQAGIKLEWTNWMIRVTQVYVTVEIEQQTYDSANRLTHIVDPEGQTVVFAYDSDSRRTSTSHPNGVTTTWTYDDADRVTKVETKKSDNTVIEKFEYTYDKAGNRLTMKDNGATTTYEYDRLYRLVKEVTPSSWTTTYQYDQVGNRVQKISGTQTTDYIYDADDRLTREEIQPLGWILLYEYDGNGNLIREWDELSNPTEYTYDQENRLTRVYYPNSGLEYVYTYTATGQRMSYASGGSTTYLGYDLHGRGGLEDTVAEYSSSGTRQARYTHGPGIDEPLAVHRSGSKYSYHGDALGSVTRITDASQGTARSYRYDGWGNIASESGTLANPYVFTGREEDPGSSLYYYRARMYDPAVGRFVGKDPGGMADGPNLYAYAGGNPVNWIDPSGMHFQGCSGWECRAGHDHPEEGSGSGVQTETQLTEEQRRALSGADMPPSIVGGSHLEATESPQSTSGKNDWVLIVAGASLLAICVIMIWALWAYGPGLIGLMIQIVQAGFATGVLEAAILSIIAAGALGLAILGPCGLGIVLILEGLGLINVLR